MNLVGTRFALEVVGGTDHGARLSLDDDRVRRDAEIANEGLLHLHRLAVRRLVRMDIAAGDDDERRLALLEAPCRDLASQLPLRREAPSRQIGTVAGHDDRRVCVILPMDVAQPAQRGRVLAGFERLEATRFIATLRARRRQPASGRRRRARG